MEEKNKFEQKLKTISPSFNLKQVNDIYTIFNGTQSINIHLTESNFTGLGWKELIEDLVLVDVQKAKEADTILNKWFE